MTEENPFYEDFFNENTPAKALGKRIKFLEEENKNLKEQCAEWERLAHEWQEDYDKLKAKYEPMILVTGDGS